MVTLIVCMLLAFIIGSVPFGLVISKVGYGVDIRNYGSGNIGATNVLRSLGVFPGVIALLCDLLKGLLPVIYARFVLGDLPVPSGLPEVLMALSVVMGHNYSIFLKFKGGKGVATSLGVFLAIDWRMALAGFFVFFIVVYSTRYISLGSMVGMTSSTVMVFILYNSKPQFLSYLFFTLVSVASVIYTHRANIQRLLAGTENKFGQKVDIEKNKDSSSEEKVKGEPSV